MSAGDNEPTSPAPRPPAARDDVVGGAAAMPPGSVPRSRSLSESDSDGDGDRLGVIASYHGMPSPTGSAMSPALDSNRHDANGGSRAVYPRDVVHVGPVAASSAAAEAAAAVGELPQIVVPGGTTQQLSAQSSVTLCGDGTGTDPADGNNDRRHAASAATVRSLRLEDQKALEAACESGRVNPLAYDWSQHAGVLQTLKMVVVGLFLLIPRVLLFGLGCGILAIGARIRRAGFTDDELNARPIPHRGPGLALMRGGARVVLFSVGYVWISVDDQRQQEDGADEAPVIVANHYGFFDAFFFGALNAPTPVSKFELLQAPFAGGLLKALQTIGVKRESADGRRQVAQEIHRRTKWRVEQSDAVLAEHPAWAPLLIFPEATNTNCRTMLEFKPGPFLPLAPIQPVTIDPRQSHLDVSWTGDCDVPLTLLRMMCQLYNKLHVTYLPVMRPLAAAVDGGGIEDPVAFCERTRVAMAAHLGVPLSGHNVTDLFLQVKDVDRLGIPLDAVNVEMGAYPLPTAPDQTRRRPSALNHVRRRLHLFAAFDDDDDAALVAAVDAERRGGKSPPPKRDGLLLEEEFARLLQYQPSGVSSPPSCDGDGGTASSLSIIASAVSQRLSVLRCGQPVGAAVVAVGEPGPVAVDFRAFLILCEALFPLLDCAPFSDRVCAATIAPPKPGGAADRRCRRSSAAALDGAGDGGGDGVGMSWDFVAPELEPAGDAALYDDCLARLAAALEDGTLAPPALPAEALAGHTQAECDALLALYRRFLAVSSAAPPRTAAADYGGPPKDAPSPSGGGARDFCTAHPVLAGVFFAAKAFGTATASSSAAAAEIQGDSGGVALEDV